MTQKQLTAVTIFESCLCKHFEDLSDFELDILKAIKNNVSFDQFECTYFDDTLSDWEDVKITVDYEYQPYERQTWDHPGTIENAEITELQVKEINSLFSYWLAFGFRFCFDTFVGLYHYDIEILEEEICKHENGYYE